MCRWDGGSRDTCVYGTVDTVDSGSLITTNETLFVQPEIFHVIEFQRRRNLQAYTRLVPVNGAPDPNIPTLHHGTPLARPQRGSDT